MIVGVGGSATTDGGLAAVQALDWSFRGVPVTVACDVTTAFTDAAVVYGPQKGASDAQVALLTRRLGQLAGVYGDRTGVDVTALEFAGAAGGLAGGLAAIGARLEPGFDVVADLVGLEDAVAGADLVVTGEGKLDATSFAGKVVGGVLELAADADVGRRGVIAGQVTDEAREEASVLGPVTVLALTDRVWHAGEAFAPRRPARRGGSGRAGARLNPASGRRRKVAAPCDRSLRGRSRGSGRCASATLHARSTQEGGCAVRSRSGAGVVGPGGARRRFDARSAQELQVLSPRRGARARTSRSTQGS